MSPHITCSWSKMKFSLVKSKGASYSATKKVPRCLIAGPETSYQVLNHPGTETSWSRNILNSIQQCIVLVGPGNLSIEIRFNTPPSTLSYFKLERSGNSCAIVLYTVNNELTCDSIGGYDTGARILSKMNEINDALKVGQLVDMKWKMGISMSSDSCRNLNTAFVTMTIKVADSSGKVSVHTFEMTVPQFQDFSKQMKEMARVMEMV